MWGATSFQRCGFAASLRLGAIVTVALLAACVRVPPASTTAAIRTATDVQAEQSLRNAAAAEWPDDNWWSAWGDAQLDALISDAISGSPDIAAAAARLRRADAAVQVSGAASQPTLDVEAAANLAKQSYNNGFPREFAPKGWNDNGQIAASLGYDPDIWGRNRAALAAATSEARAAELDARQVRLLLTTGLAMAYVDLDRLHAERDVRAASLVQRDALRGLVAARVSGGLDTRGSLRLAEAELATARAGLAATDEAMALRRNQISALAGAGPDRGMVLVRPKLSVRTAGGLPASVTTELVVRRPDVVAALARVRAASSRIAQARAEFYPAIRLTALAGLQSVGLGGLIEADSTYGKVGPAISLPLFRGGALRGNLRGAEAGYDEAVADYDRTVIAAYQQVADALTSRRLQADRLASSRLAQTAAAEALAIARLRYEGGLSTYFDVLTVEDRWLQAQLAAASLSASARGLDVALIRALGGGFNALDQDNTGESDDDR